MDKRLIDLLEYLYNCNKIPVWVADGDKKLLFTSAPPFGLRKNDEINEFFDYFYRRVTGDPLLISVNGIEFFACFKLSLKESGDDLILIIGPAFNVHPVSQGYTKHLALDYIYEKEAVKEIMLATPTVGTAEFGNFTRTLLSVLTNREYELSELARQLTDVSLKKIVDKQLSKIIFEIREEEQIPVHSYKLEQRYVSCVRSGEPEALKKLPRFAERPVKGIYAPKSQNLMVYEIVAALTLATRAAIEGGVPAETAYNLSDLYLQKIDNARSRESLAAISKEIFTHFAERVNEEKSKDVKKFSNYVAKTMQYVRTHLHYPITLDSAANAVGLNAKYLSKIFAEQTGMKFTAFIQAERVNEAKDLLVNTDYSLLDISNILVFSSQSYFIKVFSQHTGKTPQRYREERVVL